MSGITIPAPPQSPEVAPIGHKIRDLAQQLLGAFDEAHAAGYEIPPASAAAVAAAGVAVFVIAAQEANDGGHLPVEI